MAAKGRPPSASPAAAPSAAPAPEAEADLPELVDAFWAADQQEEDVFEEGA